MEKNVDVFGTFLDKMKTAQQADQDTSAYQRRVFLVLQKGPTPITELVEMTQAPLTSLLQLLKSLQELEVVTIKGEGTQDIVSLTDKGMEFAKQFLSAS